MTNSPETRDEQAPAVRRPYAAPKLTAVGSVAELTLGVLVTGMPENGGSGTSQV